MVFQRVLLLSTHGKAKIGAKPGPKSILTAAEETKLVEYVVHEQDWLWMNKRTDTGDS